MGTIIRTIVIIALIGVLIIFLAVAGILDAIF